MHRRFAEAPSSLVRPFLVVVLDPIIEIAVQLADRAVDFLAEGDAVELVEHGLVEPLNNSIRLRAFGLGARVIDILERQVELIFMMLGIAAIFRATIGQHAAELHLVGVVEGHDPIVEQVGGGDRRLAVIELGEGDLGVGVDKVCW